MSRAACVGITPHADKTETRIRQGSLTAPLHAKIRKDMAKIKIAKGNAFVYSLPLVELNADGTKENVQAADVQDLQVICARACGATFEPEFTSDGNRLYISFAADLQVAEYNLTVTGSLHAVQDFALQMQAAFEIVQWDSQSNWRDYIIGEAIAPEDTPLIAGVFNSDEEWERLKEELRLQIAAAHAAEEAAEAAKREWEQKAAELDDVAQEATLTQGVQDIRADIANIDVDTSDLAKEATLQQIIDANILRPNLQGFTFDDGWGTDNIAAILAYVKLRMHGELYSEMTIPIGDSAFQNCAQFTSANFPNATSVGRNTFGNCTGLTSANFPNATGLYNYAFDNCSKLTSLNILNVTGVVNSALIRCANLIDLHIGQYLNNSLNLKTASWDPTNAYSGTSRSLVPADVQALHPEWYNRDYLLYCLREHFAANLPDRTGQTALTITFNPNMKTHINNSPETVAAFTDKNWIIA